MRAAPTTHNLVSLGLDVAVGVRRLADGRVTHLLLDPAEVCTVAQEPRRVRVAGRVVLAVGQTSFTQ